MARTLIVKNGDPRLVGDEDPASDDKGGERGKPIRAAASGQA